MAIDEQASAAKPLPKSKVALEALFVRCEECLRSVDRARHRTEELGKLFLKLNDEKVTLKQFSRYQVQIREAYQRDKSDYSPH